MFDEAAPLYPWFAVRSFYLVLQPCLLLGIQAHQNDQLVQSVPPAAELARAQLREESSDLLCKCSQMADLSLSSVLDFEGITPPISVESDRSIGTCTDTFSPKLARPKTPRQPLASRRSADFRLGASAGQFADVASNFSKELDATKRMARKDPDRRAGSDSQQIQNYRFDHL